MKFKYEDIKKIFSEFETSKDSLDPLLIKKIYLSKKGLIRDLYTKLKDITAEQRKDYGKEINNLKNYIEEIAYQKKLTTKNTSHKSEIDLTAPFNANTKFNDRPRLRTEGTTHPTSTEMTRILNIFYQMGFNVEESRQLDDDYHMFETLNIPKGHPARDIWDTFWTEEGLIPPAHTSTMQNRVMKKYKNPPIRVVMPGRCFRNEATDASHEHTFYQIEGVYIDKNISIGDMFGTIKTYLEAFFETELDVMIQPAYFPFTEPDCEFAIGCPFCKKTGCQVCGYTGWLELMGCGMIHPTVLKEGGIDPDIYSGFAWGFGLDRLIMVKNAIKDVRRFHSADLNFLLQFKK